MVETDHFGHTNVNSILLDSFQKDGVNIEII